MQAYSLFEHYPVSGSSIKSAAEDTRGRVASVDQVIVQLEQDHRQAVASVSGTLEESVADAPTEAITRANDFLQQAEYAAGCLVRPGDGHRPGTPIGDMLHQADSYKAVIENRRDIVAG